MVHQGCGLDHHPADSPGPPVDRQQRVHQVPVDVPDHIVQHLLAVLEGNVGMHPGLGLGPVLALGSHPLGHQ